MRELELRHKELELQLKVKELEIQSKSSSNVQLHSNAFDVTRHIRLVPQFQEKEVDKYFLHFEKLAKTMEWPKESWVVLVQGVLTGKAQEAYSALSIEQSSNYETVKKEILKAYELVPEAYCQKFRNNRKQDTQTYMEFGREKERL